MSTLIQYLTVTDVADVFQVSAHTVRQWIAERPPVIPYFKIGGTVRFNPADVHEVAETRKRGARKNGLEYQARFYQKLSQLISAEVDRQLHREPTVTFEGKRPQ